MNSTFSLNINGSLLSLASPVVMGILNITPDSFYADSRTMLPDDIKKRADILINEGAGIIDIGAYSSRPGADDVSPEEEWRRLDYALDIVRDNHPEAIISVDTFRAEIAEKCVSKWNVNIINDISGGDLDPDMASTVASLRVPYIVMHMKGTPANMQQLTDYDDVTADVITTLAHKVDKLHLAGVKDVIVDPGFGFAKTVEQNYRLLADLHLFKALNVPLLVGMSHKSMIWRPLSISPADSRDGTIVLDTIALLQGANIIRVHDVKPAVETIKLIELLKKSAPDREIAENAAL